MYAGHDSTLSYASLFVIKLTLHRAAVLTSTPPPHPQPPPQKKEQSSVGSTEAKFLVPDWGDKVDFGNLVVA